METIMGILHVIRTRKSRTRGSSLGSLLTDALAVSLENDGLIERREYAPMYYITTGKKRATLGGKEIDYYYKFKGQPKAFTRDMEGYTVTVRCKLDCWENGIGDATCHRACTERCVIFLKYPFYRSNMSDDEQGGN